MVIFCSVQGIERFGQLAGELSRQANLLPIAGTAGLGDPRAVDANLPPEHPCVSQTLPPRLAIYKTRRRTDIGPSDPEKAPGVRRVSSDEIAIRLEKRQIRRLRV